MRRDSLWGVQRLMGSIWQAAKREEGYRLGYKEGPLIWCLVIMAMIGHGIFRFFSGRPILGDRHRKTNATWNEPGTKLYHENSPLTRKPSRWSYLPERTRAMIRIGLLIVTIDIVWGFWDGTPFDGSGIHNTLTVMGILITWRALYLLTHAFETWRKDRRANAKLVNPIKAALGPILGMEPGSVKLRPNIAALRRKGH